MATLEEAPYFEYLPPAQVQDVEDEASEDTGFSLAEIEAFNDRLTSIAPHQRAGYLDNFYARIRNEQDPQILKAGAAVIEQWSRALPNRNRAHFEGLSLRLSSLASQHWAPYHLRKILERAGITPDPELIERGSAVIGRTKDRIQDLFHRAGLGNPLLGA